MPTTTTASSAAAASTTDTQPQQEPSSSAQNSVLNQQLDTLRQGQTGASFRASMAEDDDSSEGSFDFYPLMYIAIHRLKPNQALEGLTLHETRLVLQGANLEDVRNDQKILQKQQKEPAREGSGPTPLSAPPVDDGSDEVPPPPDDDVILTPRRGTTQHHSKETIQQPAPAVTKSAQQQQQQQQPQQPKPQQPQQPSQPVTTQNLQQQPQQPASPGRDPISPRLALRPEVWFRFSFLILKKIHFVKPILC